MRESDLRSLVMKTFNSKRAISKRFNLGIIVFALAATLGFTACQNGGGGSSVATPVYPGALPPGVAPCAGCPANMGFLASALGQSFDPFMGRMDIEMGLDFFGDLNFIHQFPQVPGLGGFSYSGSVMAGGAMNVVSQSPSCPMLPLGTYTIQSSAGVWGGFDGRSFEIQVTLVGPVQTQAIMSGYITPATPPVTDMYGTKSYPYRFTASYMRLQGPWGVCYLDYLLQ